MEKSIETHKKALDLEPEFPVAHNNLAIALLEAGRVDEAARHLEKAEALGYEVAPEIKQEIAARR